MKRDDFDFNCECGYYACNGCKTPWYPMEVSEDKCPECGEGVMISWSMLPNDVGFDDNVKFIMPNGEVGVMWKNDCGFYYHVPEEGDWGPYESAAKLRQWFRTKKRLNDAFVTATS